MIGGLRSEVVSVVVYHLLKVSKDSGWKVNRTHLFGSFQLKISGSNKTCEKPVFPGGIFQVEICVPFLQSHLKFAYHKPWTNRFAK